MTIIFRARTYARKGWDISSMIPLVLCLWQISVFALYSPEQERTPIFCLLSSSIHDTCTPSRNHDPGVRWGLNYSIGRAQSIQQSWQFPSDTSHNERGNDIQKPPRYGGHENPKGTKTRYDTSKPNGHGGTLPHETRRISRETYGFSFFFFLPLLPPP